MSSDRVGVRLRRGRAIAPREERPGAVEWDVEIDGEPAVALAYPELVGPLREGDAVVLNTGAVALGLGTGGLHLVVAVPDGPATELREGARTMKARYLPHQVAVSTVEEDHREAIEGSPGLGGTPVVCAPLHSMVAPIAAGARVAGARSLVYVMTDGAALAGALSRLVPRLRGAGLLDGWITSGQAFGGELEAITVWTGLLAAVEVLEADVVIVADGPGNLGSDTTWGVTALASGVALNAVEALGGRPVAALRVSFADRRERQRGVSHHSLTILERVATCRANVVVPTLDGDERDRVWGALRARGLEDRHQLVEADGRPALDELERMAVAVESMGRTPAEDPAFFLSAGAAGIVAARMAAGSAAWRREHDPS
jgi:hypothetical protein